MLRRRPARRPLPATNLDPVGVELRRPPVSPMTKRHRGLRFAGLTKRTVNVYQHALDLFFTYLEDECITLPSDYESLDHLLAAYIEIQYLDDMPITYSGHLLSALRRFLPQCRFHLPTARQWFANWKSSYTPTQAIPSPARWPWPSLASPWKPTSTP